MVYPDGLKELRWGFIKKVYGILAAQMCLTIIVSLLTLFYSSITNQLLRGISGLFFFFFIACLPTKHPLNFFFLGLFAASVSVAVEVECANMEGKVVIEALTLTSAVVSTLTCFTFWGSMKRNHDFNFFEPILFWSLFILFLFFLLSLILPSLGPTLSLFGAMVFSGYVVYYTDNLIRRCSYDQCIWASALLYWDIVYLFFSILRVLRCT